MRICQLVERMPLGIELAAAWVRVLSCREIAHEIERGAGLLSTSTRDAPARHRSMEAVFDHSWQLLTQEERQVLRRLSIFRGGFQRESAETVAGSGLPLLSALAAKSLLRRASSGRYHLHELIRQYAVARLHELSGGIPRRITQLADLSLVAGAGEQLAEIDADVVEAVYHELGVVRV